MRKFFVGGNWKMNGSTAACSDLVKNVAAASLSDTVDVVIAPPSVYLPVVKSLASASSAFIQLAAQNCYNASSGAYTGEIRYRNV